MPGRGLDTGRQGAGAALSFGTGAPDALGDGPLRAGATGACGEPAPVRMRAGVQPARRRRSSPSAATAPIRRGAAGGTGTAATSNANDHSVSMAPVALVNATLLKK